MSECFAYLGKLSQLRRSRFIIFDSQEWRFSLFASRRTAATGLWLRIVFFPLSLRLLSLSLFVWFHVRRVAAAGSGNRSPDAHNRATGCMRLFHNNKITTSGPIGASRDVSVARLHCARLSFRRSSAARSHSAIPGAFIAPIGFGAVTHTRRACNYGLVSGSGRREASIGERGRFNSEQVSYSLSEGLDFFITGQFRPELNAPKDIRRRRRVTDPAAALFSAALQGTVNTAERSALFSPKTLLGRRSAI